MPNILALAHTKSLLEYLPDTILSRMCSGKFSWLLTLFFGALLPFSFAPFNTLSSAFSYLIIIPVSLFLYQLLHTQSSKQAFYRGLIFGVGLFSIGVSWLYVAIHDFGAAHWSLAGVFTLLFILFLALYYAVFAWAVFTIRQKTIITHNRLVLFFLPVLWVFFEWLRSWLLTGFPWLLVGYPLLETPLSGFAPIIGIYGLSLLVLISVSLLLAKIKPMVSLSSIVALLLCGAIFGMLQWSTPQGEPLSVSLIQGNVNQGVKWSSWQLEKTKQLYVSLSQDHWQDSDLIVWPENAIPVFYHTLANGFYHNLTLQAKKTHTELITGLPIFDDKTQAYYNAMITLGGKEGHYYKTHLVPFGEYVPLAALLRGLIQFFNLPMSGFSVGDTKQKPVTIKGHQAVVTLCYEDVFPQDIIANIPQSNFMVNLSNNGWYGDSLAPHQHLEMARMRALETGRELIRSTTSGISALINHKGDVLVKGPQFKQAVVKGTIQPRIGTTPYVVVGNYPIIILFIIMGLLIIKNK